MNLTLSVLSALSIMFAVYELAQTRVRRARLRAGELQIVEKMLATHYANLEYLLDDPGPSNEVRDFLLFVSESLSNRKQARVLCEVMADEEISAQHGSKTTSNSLVSELEVLGQTRPDLFEAFNKAFRAGVVALVYRWPENSCRAETILSWLLVEKKQEIMTVYRFSQSCPKGLSAQTA